MILHEMAVSREGFIDRVSSYSKTTLRHLLKIAVYGDKDRDFDKWIIEISAYLHNINKLVLKSNNSKGTEEEYRNQLVSYADPTWDEMESELFSFNNGDYPDFEITDDLVTDLFNYYNNFLNKYCKILSTDNKYLRADFEEMLREDYDNFFH